MKYKALIFDLDGTLLNTITDITEAMNIALADCSLPSITEEEAKYYTGSGVNILVERTLAKYPEEVKNKARDLLKKSYCTNYEKMKENNTKPYDGILETLQILKHANIKLAVLSNKPHNDALQVINHYFGDLFDVTFGQRESVPIKPDPQAVFEIIGILNVNKEDVLYVGDTNVDIATAKAANLTSIGVTYGFRTKAELQAAKADFIIDRAEDILNIVR